MSAGEPHDTPSGRPEAATHGRLASQGAVVELISPRLALAELAGDLDLSCYDLIEDLLSHAQRDVLIDLTRCDSIDSTAIGALIAAHGAATARGHRIALLVRPDQHAVTTAVRIARLADIVAVHTSRRTAFDSFRDGAGSR
jgi:anti-anti-sigma factor